MTRSTLIAIILFCYFLLWILINLMATRTNAEGCIEVLNPSLPAGVKQMQCKDGVYIVGKKG